MSIPDPDKAQRWIEIFNSLSIGKKIVVILTVCVVGGLIFYFQYWGPKAKLIKCETNNKNLEEASRHCELLLEFAKQKYPDLEANEAIDRLTKEVSETQKLITRSEFIEPTKEVLSELTNNLRNNFTATDRERLTIKIEYASDDPSQILVAKQVEKSISKAGFKNVKFGKLMAGYTYYPVVIECYPEEEALGRTLIKSLKVYVLGEYLLNKNKKLNPGIFNIYFLGKQSFEPNGQVFFESKVSKQK